MKQVSSVFILLFFIISIQAQEAIEGIWDTGKENIQIEINTKGKQYKGTIFSSHNPKAPTGIAI